MSSRTRVEEFDPSFTLQLPNASYACWLTPFTEENYCTSMCCLSSSFEFTTTLFWNCSETKLTGESRFHTSTPRGFEPGSLVMGSKQVVHWTSETWWESSEIAGSRQNSFCYWTLLFLHNIQCRLRLCAFCEWSHRSMDRPVICSRMTYMYTCKVQYVCIRVQFVFQVQ